MASSSEEIDSLLEKKDLQCMLEFETQIFLDIIHKDGLIIAAKGLNLNNVLLNLFKVYSDPGNLVIVLNFNDNEEKYFREKLNNEHVHSITGFTPLNERLDTYLDGGIHFIPTRILVVDMLKKRIPIDKITGFVILRAHKMMESCQEAFVLRLFRLNNKTGFIKAFTNSAQSFTIGFGHVERIMRALFVKELYIWPRFHSLVISSLKKFEPQVIELHIPISENMKKIQTYILELMNITVKEIKRINKTIEIQEITTENCLTKKFHKILQAQLDIIWHQLSGKSRQLVAELKTLRHLIIAMMYSDPVTFYSIVMKYRTMEYAQTSNWVLLESAQHLFKQVKALIYSGDKELNPEFCPKWESFLELLKVEIPHEIANSKQKDHKILILCSDNKTCYQLNKLLTSGPHHYLFLMALQKGIQFKTINDKFKNYANLPMGSFEEENKADVQIKKGKGSKNKKVKADKEEKEESVANMEDAEAEDSNEEECFKSSYALTMSQSISCESPSKDDTADSEYVFEPFSEMENMNITQICQAASAPTVIIQTFKGAENYVNLQKSLEDIQPSFIIMYHSDVTAIREIEMYEAHRQRDSPLKVYFLVHSGTVEEQSYLTSLRREKEAFEFLIQTKSTMVIPSDQDGKSDECLALQRDCLTPTKNTRKGGKEELPQKQTIVVDVREFRSELPALIHKRGIDIEPVMITVGDYILTPEICIERKSVSDLIGSLNSGRLYQQCTHMARYYTKPMLLIEFDQKKSFSWQNNFMVSSDGNNFDVQKKLLLLTIHFPKLKIIWSPSPYATAQLFEELKLNKDQPSVEYALSIGAEQDVDAIESKYNSNIYDFVQKLPGISSKNIDGFLRRGKNMDNVVKMSEDQLKDILANTNDAKSMYSIIHDEHVVKDDADSSKSNKGKSKSSFFKKRTRSNT